MAPPLAAVEVWVAAGMKYIEKLTRKTLGDLLIEEGLITADQVSEALHEQSNSGYPLGDILISFGLLSEWDISEALSNQLQLPFIFPTAYNIHPEVAEILPPDVLHRHQVVPLDKFDEILTICVSEVPTKEMLKELKSISKAELFLYVGLLSDVRHVLDTQFVCDDATAGTKRGGSEMDDLSSGWEQLFDSANESVMSDIDVEDEPE